MDDTRNVKSSNDESNEAFTVELASTIEDTFEPSELDTAAKSVGVYIPDVSNDELYNSEQGRRELARHSSSVELRQGRVVVKALETAAEVFRASLPGDMITIRRYLHMLEHHATVVAEAKNFPAPSRQAFSNARGTWFEILVAVRAWNYSAEQQNPNLLIIKLPSIQSFNFRRLFDKQTQQYIRELEDSLLQHTTAVRLITSNPDLLVIYQPNILSPERDTPVSDLSDQSRRKVFGAYQDVAGNISWKSLRAGLGLKTSSRPDRRLQLVHEGNILKSLFAHLKMRSWDRDARFMYYAASTEWGPADRNALETAATHTIVNVDATPERAVDELFTIQTVGDIDKIIGGMLHHSGVPREK